MNNLIEQADGTGTRLGLLAQRWWIVPLVALALLGVRQGYVRSMDDNSLRLEKDSSSDELAGLGLRARSAVEAETAPAPVAPTEPQPRPVQVVAAPQPVQTISAQDQQAEKKTGNGPSSPSEKIIALAPAPHDRVTKSMRPRAPAAEGIVRVNDTIVETAFAVKPKPLSPAVKNGLSYLVSRQQKDGGWNQGGGWRVRGDGRGARVENADDPSDLGNTCLVLLALLRSGSTATEGEYKEAIQKGLVYVLENVDQAKAETLYVTDQRGTQIQSKIGQYVDTFLVNLSLAEYRGKAGDQEEQLISSLEKTMTKIVKHQTVEGGFNGNNGWAPTLSVGIANKSIVRAMERGAVVDEVVLKRALGQAKAATDDIVLAGAPPGKTGGATPAPKRKADAGDAGVALYRVGQGAGSNQDILNSLRLEAVKAQKVLDNDSASDEDKNKAKKLLADFKKADADNEKVQAQLKAKIRNDRFVAGFGNNGGEEFLSFLNISEALVLKADQDWRDWDAKMTKGLEKAQDQGGSWSGQHCITGKTFCTASALLVLMADRTPFPVDVIKSVQAQKDNPNRDTALGQ